MPLHLSSSQPALRLSQVLRHEREMSQRVKPDPSPAGLSLLMLQHLGEPRGRGRGDSPTKMTGVLIRNFEKNP